MAEHGPSEKAEHAVARVLCWLEHGDRRYDPGKPEHVDYLNTAKAALAAAHGPALGLDRSVCLRDVVDVLREQSTATSSLLNLIERTFTESSPDREPSE